MKNYRSHVDRQRRHRLVLVGGVHHGRRWRQHRRLSHGDGRWAWRDCTLLLQVNRRCVEASGGCPCASRFGRCGQVTLNCSSTRRFIVASQKRSSKLPRSGGPPAIIHLPRGRPGGAIGLPRGVSSAGGLPELAGSRLPLPSNTSSAATQAGRGNLFITGGSKCASTKALF